MVWRRGVAVLVLAAASVVVPSAFPQQPGQVPPEGTGIILGRVVDAETNQPVSGVLLGLSGGGVTPGPSPAGISWRLLTDAQGRFVFRNLPKGAYMIVATVGGNGFSPSGFLVSGTGQQIGAYLNGGLGQLRPGGALETIDLGEGQRVPDAVIRLWKGGAIEGTVRDEAGEPLVGMVVSAVRRGGDGRLINGPTTTTDDRGAYRLGTLLPGEYVIVVPQTSVMLPTTTVDALAALPAGAAPPQNFGTAMLPRATALVGVPVGTSRILTSPLRDAGTLPPVAEGGAAHVYQTTFHPASTSAGQATAIPIRSGQARQGIDVQLQSSRAFSVAGTLVDDGGPVAQFAVHLMPVAADGASMLEVARTVTDGRGVFTFPLVAEGQYMVLATRRIPILGARGAPPPEPRTVADRAGAWAMQTIAVGGRDLSDVALVLRPPPQLSGRFEFQSATGQAAPNPQRAGLILARVPLLFRDLIGTPPATVEASGAFVVSGQPPGRYEIRIPSFALGWTLQSITVGGRDVTDIPITVEEKDISGITILFTDQPAELTGTVRGVNGAPDSTASVLMFPSDRTRWPDARVSPRTFRATRVTKSGAFTLTPLIPGNYLVVAVSEAQTGDWPDERLLNRLQALASPVSIGTGQKHTVTLKTAEIR